jgi:exopolysaccharide production protein ExoZ
MGPVFQFVGNPIILEFLMGVIISYVPAWRLGIWGIPIGVMSLVAAALIGFVPNGETFGTISFQRVLIFGVPSAMVVYGVLQIQMHESVWTYLGGASYSLYLSHIFPLTLLLVLLRHSPMPSDFIILIGILTSVLFAWRVHERFEKPMITALKGKLLTYKTSVDASLSSP